MTNLIQSMGYGIGRVHTGLIKYLCDLHHDGTEEPVKSFLDALGVKVPDRPRAVREFRSVDLAIFDGDSSVPTILVETKVDDHEGGDSPSTYQTLRYEQMFPHCDAYLFMTLGTSEFFRPPQGQRFLSGWVGAERFHSALSSIQAPIEALRHWRDALATELEFRQAASTGDVALFQGFKRYSRAGTWSTYFLGSLGRKVDAAIEGRLDISPSAYTYGTHPDTILNFGWSRHPAYMEINNNGKLHLKVTLWDLPDGGAKMARINEQKERWSAALDDWKSAFKPTRSADQKSKTIAQFDIGLSRHSGGLLGFAGSEEETLWKLQSILKTFYGTKPEATDASKLP